MSEALEQFYINHQLSETEDKIKALEKQFQEFPDLKMDRQVRLNMLERKFTGMINYAEENKSSQQTEKNKWKEAYQMVNDKPVMGGIPIAGVGHPMGGIEIEESEYYNPCRSEGEDD